MLAESSEPPNDWSWLTQNNKWLTMLPWRIHKDSLYQLNWRLTTCAATQNNIKTYRLLVKSRQRQAKTPDLLVAIPYVRPGSAGCSPTPDSNRFVFRGCRHHGQLVFPSDRPPRPVRFAQRVLIPVCQQLADKRYKYAVERVAVYSLAVSSWWLSLP